MIDVSKLPPPPVAAVRSHQTTAHGVTLTDPYFWLKDQGYPKVDDADVLEYLKAENAYTEAALKPVAPLKDRIFAEMKGRIQADDAGVPQKDGDWVYWWKFAPGGQYRIWYRKPVLSGAEGPAAGGAEQVILDEPKEAAGKDYFRMGGLMPSPDGRYIAWGADSSGAERFTLVIRDLTTGQDVETVTAITNRPAVWSADSKAVVYTEVNENWRSYRARLHRLGTPSSADRTLYEETADKGFTVGAYRTQDRQWIGIQTGDNSADETRLIPAANPDAAPILVAARRPKVKYTVDAAHGKLWVLTNDEHINFRLAEADPARPSAWKTVIPGSDRVYLTGLSSFSRHIVLNARMDGLDQVILRTYSGQESRVPFPEASYTAGLASNPEYDPAAYRLTYTSMVTPATVYDYDPATGALQTLKVQQIPSGYDKADYVTERLMLPARDGKRVPVSVMYRKGFAKDGKAPLYLYAYGAYGHAITPAFNANWLSFADRGYAVAIAHIRGGDDLGYGWYLDGTATNRWNTFRDFVDVAKGLVAERYTSAGRIAAQGGSAGGELMGVIANTDPKLFGAIVADVPFVDVLNTMSDESLPLTPGEWPEWGNPITDPAAFKLLLSYSPYDNVTAQAYPPLLITGGLNDPRVTYWEPAKWAAKLRTTKTDSNPLLLKINMGAGHGGKTGRYVALEERAEAYAFIVSQLGYGAAAKPRIAADDSASAR